MKKIITLSAFLLFGFSNAIAQDRQVKTGNYDKIQVSGSYTVNLVAGAEGNITINGEDPERLIEVETEGNTLKIHSKKLAGKDYNRKSIVITVPVESLNEVTLSGSGNINSAETLKSSSFLAMISGSGRISLNIEAQSIAASVSGSGKIELNGKAQNLDSAVSGSGSINAFDLITAETTSMVSGSGTSKINTTEKIRASVSGSGNIYYKGNPKKDDIKVSGSGKVIKA